MKHFFVASTFICAAALPAAADWICEGKRAVGYDLGNGQWQRTNFTNPERRFIVRAAAGAERSVLDGQAKFVAVELGSDDPMAYFTCDIESGNICSSRSGYVELAFSSKSLRYSITRTLHFVDGSDQYWPFLEIGFCSKF